MGMNEAWRAVLGFGGVYEVSDLGRIRGIRRQGSAGGELRGTVHKKTGYRRVRLRHGPERVRMVELHALVLEAFVGPRPAGMECRHLDGDKMNNRAKNLAWGTRSENLLDRTRHKQLEG
jgi:hypothetical protein